MRAREKGGLFLSTMKSLAEKNHRERVERQQFRENTKKGRGVGDATGASTTDTKFAHNASGGE